MVAVKTPASVWMSASWAIGLLHAGDAGEVARSGPIVEGGTAAYPGIAKE